MSKNKKMLSYLNKINKNPNLKFNEIFEVDLDFHARKSIQ